jgi:hypothetical protein
MRTLVMGRVMVFLIAWLFRRGRVHRMTHQLVKCVFDVFDVGTLVLKGLSRGTELYNVGIYILDVLQVVMDVVSNQFIEFLGASDGHLGRGKKMG